MITDYFVPIDPPRQLPTPSEEQTEILRAVREGACAIVIARAGTGKTTASLLLAQDAPERRHLVLTYNRALADETNDRIRELNLKNVVCRTYHEQVGRCASRPDHRVVCLNDAKLLRVLREWRCNNGGTPVARLTEYDRVILDESQDMRPTFYEALTYMLPTAEDGGCQLVVMGDPKQLLYDYGGDNAASASYLERANHHFAAFTVRRPWVRCGLRISYRLPPKIARLVNTVWDTDIQSGNLDGPDLAVEYWHLYSYDSRIRERLARLIDEADRPEDVILLNWSNVSSSSGRGDVPIRHHINELLRETSTKSGLRKYNFHIKNHEHECRDGYRSKVRAWTFCASKGCGVKTVVVFGFDAYRGVPPPLNQLCVALSRASVRLVVIHGMSWNADTRTFVALPYVPPLNATTLRELVERGVVDAVDGVPEDVPICVPPPEVQALSVTAVTHLSATTVEELLAMGDRIQVADGASHSAPLQLVTTFRTGLRSTEQDVSALYGTAVPFVLQWRRTRRIPDVERMLNPLLICRHTHYSVADVLRAMDTLCVDVDEHDAAVLGELFTKEPKVCGRDLLKWLDHNRNRLAVFETLGICERQRFDDIFAETHGARVRERYDQLNDSVADFMYLANASNAFEASHELLVQMGDDYDSWVDESAFRKAVRTLEDVVPASARFEVGCRVSYDPEVAGQRKVYDEIVGRVDAMGDNDQVYEFKYCTALSEEHELQALLYAAVACLQRGRARGSTTLVNARTGAVVRYDIDAERAATLLRRAAERKVV